MIPTAIIFIWFSGLLSLGIIAGAVYLLREWYQTSWVAVLARGMLGMLRYDATTTLKTIHIPTLVVAANRDPVCKPEASERIS
jgi:hypothetical protein